MAISDGAPKGAESDPHILADQLHPQGLLAQLPRAPFFLPSSALANGPAYPSHDQVPVPQEFVVPR